MIVAMHGTPPRRHALYQRFATLQRNGAAICPLYLINWQWVTSRGVGVPEVQTVEGRVGQGIASLGYQLFIFAHFRAQRGEQVSHDGRVDAHIEGLLHGFLTQL